MLAKNEQNITNYNSLVSRSWQMISKPFITKKLGKMPQIKPRPSITNTLYLLAHIAALKLLLLTIIEHIFLDLFQEFFSALA